MSRTKLKFLIVMDAFFFGLSSSLTSGLLFVYVVSIGAGVWGISIVVGISAVVKLIVHLILYKYPLFLMKRLKTNFIIQYVLDRVFFILIPFTTEYLFVALFYAAAASTPTSSFTNLVIFGSFSEKDIKDVTAKRTSALGISSILGYSLAIVLLAALPPETKFLHIFALGVMIGLICPIIVSSMNLSHLKEIEIPKSIRHPEKLFSTSAYFIVVLAGGSLLLMAWVPYVMDYLNGPDYLAIAMNLVVTLTSVFASLICKNWSFKRLRSSVGMDVMTPILALATPIPILHPLISAFSSFAYTGANFIGSFLFADYKQWLGAIKSSILMVLIMCIANILVAPIGMFAREEYFLLFMTIILVKFAAFIIAISSIPEVAAVSEETARLYSSTIYNRSITGYRISIELSKTSIMTTLRLIGFAAILLTLYFIYRTLFLLLYS